MSVNSELNILYVEDEPLIAMETEDMLSDMGVANLKIVHTFDAARAVLAQNTYDLAIMDMNLNGTLSTPLVEIALEQGARVVITTGYNSAESLGGRTDVVTIRKPFSEKDLENAIMRALNSGESLAATAN